MVADPRDLERSRNGRMRIEQDDGRIVPARPGNRQDHVQSGAVQEGELGDVQMQLALGRREFEKCICELRRSSEIELSCQAQALRMDERRHLEHRH